VFDGVRFLAGDISSISARVAHVGGDITWHGTARLASSGGLASFEISANVHADWSEGFLLFGEHGRISVESHFPFFRRPSDVSVYLENEELDVSPSFGDSNAYERQLEAFARAIVDDTAPVPDGRDGVEAVRILEAVAASTAGDGEEIAL
jgi:predicted dehydrogenase